MIFAGIQKSSLMDYPGLISCVLFVPGCNIDCFYCHNRSLLDGTAETLDTEEIWKFLKKRVGLLDGVVVTGGEPTLYPDLCEILGKIRALGYSVKLDTNGSNPKTVKRVLESGNSDYFAVDYKAPAARYTEICGPAADAHSVQETIGLLLENGANFEVRTTVCPGLRLEDLLQMAKELPPVPRWSLNGYRIPEKYKPCDKARITAGALTQEQLREAAKAMSAIQPNMLIPT